MANSKFHHEEIYRGKDLIAKLGTFNITICGVGALGSNLTDNLVRQGFSKLRVIDKDRVEIQNLNTQVYGEKDVGALKVAALKNKVFRDVGVEVDDCNKELTGSNVKSLLKGSGLVIDAFDNSASRKLIQDEIRARKLPCLHVGLYEDYGEVIWDENYKVPKDVEGDVCDYPLARNIIMLSVAVASEEILDFCLNKSPRKASWSITLKDLAVRRI
jgi:molybdopterin/thiamine biosynthesis adenylyltransferase